MPKAFLTATEVAQLFRLHIETIYLLIAKEGLPAAKIGHRWRFEESKVRAWFQNRYVSERTAYTSEDA